MPKGVRNIAKSMGTTSTSRDFVTTELARLFTDRDISMIKLGRVLAFDPSKNGLYPVASTQNSNVKHITRRGRPRANQVSQAQVA